MSDSDLRDLAEVADTLDVRDPDDWTLYNVSPADWGSLVRTALMVGCGSVAAATAWAVADTIASGTTVL